jgi:HEAT repeat protein
MNRIRRFLDSMLNRDDRQQHPTDAYRGGLAEKRIEQLSVSSNFAEIPELFWLFVQYEGPISNIAAKRIEEIMGACTPLDIVRLEQRFRMYSEWSVPFVKPENVLRMAQGKAALLGLFSMHLNGYAREAAINGLAECEVLRALPFLLIRLNDWVPQVRLVARGATNAMRETSNAEAFINCLPIIARLEKQCRGSHQETLGDIFDFLRSLGCRGALRKALNSRDKEARHRAFKLLISPPGTDLLEVLTEASESSDMVLRLWAAHALWNNLPFDKLEMELDRLLRDPFMPVRREALYGFLARLPEKTTERLRVALFDARVSVRELARFYLKQSGTVDFAELYRQRLSQAGEDLAVLVTSLGETGDRRDLATIEPYLANPDPTVRRAAIFALARLDSEGDVERFLAALNDPSARVAKAARRVIQERPYALNRERATDLFANARYLHSRRIIVSLMRYLSWWDSAPLLMNAATSEEPIVRATAINQLQLWRRNCYRTSCKPTEEQLELYEKGLESALPFVDLTTQKDLSEHLRLGKAR